jgi:exodeoxyribonuclease VII large subunit
MPVGEGALRRAADLLAAKLQAEGLFASERKRRVPYPPRRVALLTAGNSAAYADFIKIVSARWQGIAIDHYDVQVQGEAAPAQIVSAIATANSQAEVPDVLILTRGGGSADDLAAFNDEHVVRAVAGSRVPTLVAIGHEIDESLAELAADKRASTPSNAAELLTPDRAAVLVALHETRGSLDGLLKDLVRGRKAWLKHQQELLARELRTAFDKSRYNLDLSRRLLRAYDPQAPLQRGYALVQVGGKTIRHVADLQVGEIVQVRLSDGYARATIEQVEG